MDRLGSSIFRNRKRRTQNPSKSLKNKNTYLEIFRYIAEANGKSLIQFTNKRTIGSHTDCVVSLWMNKPAWQAMVFFPSFCFITLIKLRQQKMMWVLQKYSVYRTLPKSSYLGKIENYGGIKVTHFVTKIKETTNLTTCVLPGPMSRCSDGRFPAKMSEMWALLCWWAYSKV